MKGKTSSGILYMMQWQTFPKRAVQPAAFRMAELSGWSSEGGVCEVASLVKWREGWLRG